jgi:putative GTP pyrophosphokinase
MRDPRERPGYGTESDLARRDARSAVSAGHDAKTHLANHEGLLCVSGETRVAEADLMLRLSDASCQRSEVLSCPQIDTVPAYAPPIARLCDPQCGGGSLVTSGDSASSPSAGETSEEVVQSILADYDRASRTFGELAEKLETLVEDLLRTNRLRYHSVAGRQKARASLERKLRTGGGKYGGLQDITDVVGIRVITYFSDDVDSLARVFEQEFDIDRENSIDRREVIEPDRFGYISLHYVAELPLSRTELTEMARFSGLVFEIQVRSILQHAWAEIEHDLGYKAETAIPRLLRRRFSRVAGMLEAVDEEFSRLRNDSASYAASIEETVIARPDTASLDRDSVRALMETNALVRELDERIRNVSGLSMMFLDEEELASVAGSRSRDLQAAGFESVADVERALDARGDHIVRFAARWLRSDSRTSQELPPGISLFYLGYLSGLQSRSRERLVSYLQLSSVSVRLDIEKIADDLLAAFQEEFPLFRVTWKLVNGDFGTQSFDTEEEAMAVARTVDGIALVHRDPAGSVSVFRAGKELAGADAAQAIQEFSAQ